MDQRLVDWLNCSTWNYAKTMPKHPHWYINRMKLIKEEDHQIFCDVVEYIREHGYQERFFRKKITYYDIGRWKFWTMGGEIVRDRKVFEENKGLNNNNFEGGYVEFILNVAHKNGLPPSVVDPNSTKFKMGSSDDRINKKWFE